MNPRLNVLTNPMKMHYFPQTTKRMHWMRFSEYSALDKKSRKLTNRWKCIEAIKTLTWIAPPSNEKPARFTRTFSSKLLLSLSRDFCENATGSNERMMKWAIWKETMKFYVGVWMERTVYNFTIHFISVLKLKPTSFGSALVSHEINFNYSYVQVMKKFAWQIWKF